MVIPFRYSLRNLRARRLTTILTSGGMALVVGWWGVWHTISALSLALFWACGAREPRPSLALSP